MADLPHPSSNWAYISWKPVHQISVIYSTMHIYPLHNDWPDPLLLASINLWKTITPNKFHIWHNAHIPMADQHPPPPIQHRSLENHYTKSVSYKHNAHIPMAELPLTPSIWHRCLEYHYTKLGRSTGRSIPWSMKWDALHTVTPNLTDLLADLPPSIKQSCLEYSYAKLGRSTPPPSQLSIDALNTITPNLVDLPPSQSSIDALNTTTPNLAGLPQRTSTYERPFTHECNYLVHSCSGNTVKCSRSL